MSWSKREIIVQALDEIGVHQYEYDSTADELQSAQRILDSMMGVWINSGIVFEPQYPLTTNIDATNIDDDTNAPFEAIEAMYLMLGIRLAPGYGKIVGLETKVNAKKAYTGLLRNFAVGFEFSLGRFIRGAAAKRPLYPYNNALQTNEELLMAQEQKAENVTIQDVLDFYVSLNVEGALAEIGPLIPLTQTLPDYANNAAAEAAGLKDGEFYRIGDTLAIVHG